VSVNDLSVGRNPNEVLRVLDALQTDELCPCNWEKGQETLRVYPVWRGAGRLPSVRRFVCKE
jgi:alkyl hydroperoxide reductase subunit AhpC